jgi:hypothetical protein
MKTVLKITTLTGSLALALSAKAADFKKDVLPMLEKKCMSCHRAPYKTASGRTKKPKGKLDLSTPAGIKAGGGEGDSIVPKDAAKSLVYGRVTLDKSDDDFMPPEGKADPLTEAELKALKAWIDAGAETGDWKGTKFDAAGKKVGS